MTASRRYAHPPRISRNAAIAGGVLAFHAAVLWAIQSGLVQRVVEVVTPVVMISEIITPPEPKAPPMNGQNTRTSDLRSRSACARYMREFCAPWVLS